MELCTFRRSVGVVAGCDRREQCHSPVVLRTTVSMVATTSPDKCENGGECMDMWTHFQCNCRRPFIRPLCRHKFVEVRRILLLYYLEFYLK